MISKTEVDQKIGQSGQGCGDEVDRVSVERQLWYVAIQLIFL